jgi:hypothetical protein
VSALVAGDRRLLVEDCDPEVRVPAHELARGGEADEACTDNRDVDPSWHRATVAPRGIGFAS